MDNAVKLIINHRCERGASPHHRLLRSRDYLERFAKAVVVMMSTPMVDAGLVFSVLEAACYPDVLISQQAAMKSLQDFESMDGFTTSLIQIVDSDDIPDSKSDCRLLAVINLKNVVSRCWKTRGLTVHLLDANERKVLKSFLLKRSLCKEKDSRIVTQLSILVAQIAKADWPLEWPELLPTLYAEVSSEDNVPRLRRNDAMTFFYSAIQELSSKTIANARIEFRDSLIYMFPYFSKKWYFSSSQLLNILPQCFSSDNNFDNSMQTEANGLATELLIMTEVLEIILLKVFPSISSNANFSEFFILFTEHQRKYFSIFQTLPYEVFERFQLFLNKYDLNDEISGHNDGIDIDKIHSNIINERGVGTNKDGEIIVLLLRISNITRKMYNIPLILQKENPLQMVPYLGKLLESFSYDLNNTYQSIHKLSVLSNPLYNIVLTLLKSSCISSILFISNTISCKFYTNEINNVAKLKEKLNLRLLSNYKEGESNENPNQVSF